MTSVRRHAFGLGILLSTLGWLSAASAQEPNASCQAIRNACRDAGFTVGGPPGERLMIDCFEPLVHGAARAAGGARALPDIPAPMANGCQATLGPAATVANQSALRTPIPLQPAAAPRLEVDLRGEIEKLGLSVKNQGSRATCSVFATTFLIEYQTARAQKANGFEFSEEYLNWAKNQANRTDFDGGKFSDIIRGYQAFGMVPRSDMPDQASFDPRQPATPQKPTIAAGKAFPRFRFAFIKEWNNQNGMSEKQLEAAKAALRSGRPVATGIWWLNRFETVMVDQVPLLKEYPRSANRNTDAAKNPMFDGHSIDLVGYQEGSEFPGGGYFVYRNSFGPRFGQGGYGFVSFDYMRNYANDAIVIQP